VSSMCTRTTRCGVVVTGGNNGTTSEERKKENSWVPVET